MARMLMALVLSGLTAGSLLGQDTRFVWKAGQVLTYRVEQQTLATEVTGDSKAETKTKLTLTKRWQVQGVDAGGVATLQHSLTHVRMETTTPAGETLIFDSDKPEASDPKLREPMSRLVGVPLSTLRIDGTGRVVEVKVSKFGPASRFEAEPPFAPVFTAGAAFKPDTSWERAYHITQEPPFGTGEKYEAVQRYTCKQIEGTTATVEVTTDLRTQPPALSDRVPLLQLQPEGVIVFDVKNGRMQSVQLKVEKEIKGHAGDNSSYRFLSNYSEQLISDR